MSYSQIEMALDIKTLSTEYVEPECSLNISGTVNGKLFDNCNGIEDMLSLNAASDGIETLDITMYNFRSRQISARLERSLLTMVIFNEIYLNDGDCTPVNTGLTIVKAAEDKEAVGRILSAMWDSKMVLRELGNI